MEISELKLNHTFIYVGLLVLFLRAYYTLHVKLFLKVFLTLCYLINLCKILSGFPCFAATTSHQRTVFSLLRHKKWAVVFI